MLYTIISILTITHEEIAAIIFILQMRKPELGDVRCIAHAPQPPRGRARTGNQAATPMPVSCPRPCPSRQSSGLTVFPPQPQGSRLPLPAKGPSWLHTTRWESPRVPGQLPTTVTPRSSSNPTAPPLKGPINPLLSGPYRNRPTAASGLR